MKNPYLCDVCGCHLDAGEGLRCDECGEKLQNRAAASRRINEAVRESDFGQIEMRLQEA